MRPLIYIVAVVGCVGVATSSPVHARAKPVPADPQVSAAPTALAIAPFEAPLVTIGAGAGSNPFIFEVGASSFSEAYGSAIGRTDLQAFGYVTSGFGVRAGGRESTSAGGEFVMPAITGTALDPVRLLPVDRFIDGRGLVQWQSGEIHLDPSSSNGAVDTVRMTIGGVARLPAGLALGRNAIHADLESESFDLSYTRGWPAALSFKAGAYDLDVSPHAGLGMSNAGGSAEAGAMVRLGSGLSDAMVQRVASGLGVHAVDGKAYGSQSRWYLFAAASGRAVGLNMTRDGQNGDLRRAGWSVDPSAAIIGDTQAGIGWRRGPMQASVGYLHREIKNEFGVRGAGGGGDSMVAFSLSIHPHQ